MGGELIGIGAAVLTWAAAVASSIRAERVALRDLPSSWLEHPVVGPGHRAGFQRRPADYARHLVSVLPWLALFALLFAWLSASDVALYLQLAVCVAAAASWTQAERGRRRAELRDLVEGHGLEPLRRQPWLSLWYDGSLALAWVGLLGLALFAARLVVEALS
jgi:hypothetical protein